VAVVSDQLLLFADGESNGPAVIPTTGARGPKGVLIALIEIGLPEDALESAAALILELDRMAAEDE
jgi:hypothetical protein